MTAHASPIEEPADEFLIQDIETFRMLSHPMRTTILQLVSLAPRSVRDMADRLGVPVTRLYYHVNMLEDAGLIRVAEVRKAGAMLQKVYQAAAHTYRPAPDLLDNADDPAAAAQVAVATVLDAARHDAEAALERRFSGSSPEDTPGSLGRSVMVLTPQQVRSFVDELNELFARYEGVAPDGVSMGFSFSFFPLAGVPIGLADE